jgi:hypothetical protein
VIKTSEPRADAIFRGILPYVSGSQGLVKLPRNWNRLVRKVMRRCGRRCEWERAEFKVRCNREATMVVHVGKKDDHTLDNLLGLCTWHAAQKAQLEWEASRFVAIKVRPSREDGNKD